MEYIFQTATGIDSYIQEQLGRLYKFLKSVWGVNDSNYNAFGRTERNHSDGGYVPMWYSTELQSYIDGSGDVTAGSLFFDNTMAAISFYSLVDPVKKAGDRDDIAKVQLYFFVDLMQITPSGISESSQRLDEVAINDVRNFLQNNGCGFSMTDVYRSVDKILENYSGSYKRKTLLQNMNSATVNFLAFRIDMQMPYNAQINTTNYIPPMAANTVRTITLFIKQTPDTSVKIPVGNGKVINQQYAATDILIPCNAGEITSYLAGKVVQYPFYYGGTFDQTPTYNTVTGQWDKTAVGGFQPNPDSSDPGTPVTITFTDFA